MNIEQMKKRQQSIIWFLIDNLDQFEDLKGRIHKPQTDVDGNAASTLFNIWKDQKNKISENLYQRPATISKQELDVMKKEGLISDLGNKIKLTPKGEKVIKIMILGDERSSFDNNEYQINYADAIANVKERSLKQSNKKYEHRWWADIEKCLE
jgi:hypothetical protein